MQTPRALLALLILFPLASAEPTLIVDVNEDTRHAGDAIALYVQLEDGGSTLPNEIVEATFWTGPYELATLNATTDAAGKAVLVYAPPSDVASLNWIATWTPPAGEPIATNGTIAFHDTLAEIAADHDRLALEGVHLNDLGSRNLFLTSARAAGAVALGCLLILLVIMIAIRV